VVVVVVEVVTIAGINTQLRRNNFL
jgi:hypothetical protein